MLGTCDTFTPDYDTIDLSPIQKVLEVADAVKAAWQAVPPSDFGLESVTLRCQPFSYEVAIEVLRKLQPLRCHLISVPGSSMTSSTAMTIKGPWSSA